jgi:Protein of unknown function (DUF3833)
MAIALTIALALVLLLVVLRHRYGAFQAQSPADMANTAPLFDLRQHLTGQILCEGLIYGPTGRVTSRFVANIVGSWDGDTGTLREEFHYDSGTVQNRVWTLQVSPGGAIRATAPDVVGTGTGQAAGAAVQMKYNIRLPADAGGHVLGVTDWMYLLENGTIMNRSQFTKFGFTVAELVATLRKVPTEGDAA